MLDLPPRYESIVRLGAGGGGEVWSVRDRVGGGVMAFKVLSADAGAPEVDALVREAVSLSGLEGLGVPRVAAFGTLGDGRRYMVRELVEGRSLEHVLRHAEAPGWLEAIASACDQLTVVHRAGLLHGDIKPANIIVGAGGRGTLVDLGLAAPWREGGTAAQGLTPKYAAPELLNGEPLTVRAEVFALGATLAEALASRGAELAQDARAGLERVAARATLAPPASRWPSVDELASALRLAASLAPSTRREETPWPVVGFDVASRSLLEAVRATEPRDAVALEGPRGSGKTTLARRLAWTLGAQGHAVAMIEAPASGMAMIEGVELELAQYLPALTGQPPRPLVVVVDDAERLDEPARAAVRRASEAGARLVVVAPLATTGHIVSGQSVSFALPPLDRDIAEDLVHRSVPSLPDTLRAHLVEHAGRRPGTLRAAVRRLAGRAIVSKEDVDAALEGVEGAVCGTLGVDRTLELEGAERALDRGRLDDAALALATLGSARDNIEQVRMGLVRARIAIGQGEAAGALSALEAIEPLANAQGRARTWQTIEARALLRAGRYSEAAARAQAVVATGLRDALEADALSVRGVALAFVGDGNAAREVLDEAIALARSLGDPRMEAVALGSSAIAHQRAGRSGEARASYDASLIAAERAQDAATVATMRLNLASIAHAEGDLAQALMHLEATVDMGRRAGLGLAVTQALLNLATLDLYLGRASRARASLDQLASRRGELSEAARTQLLGLEAEHAARTGNPTQAASLYEQAAHAWEAQGRSHDVAEVRLEGLLARTRAPGADASALAGELASVRRACGEAGLGEHEALAELVRAAIAQASGQEDIARRALDASLEAARKAGRSEWAWQALDARAKLAAAQGGMATARRDTEAALSMLEETASRLPRDLREVFWDDPRRRALRQAHTATLMAPSLAGANGGPLAPLRPASGTTSMFSGASGEDRLARIFEITRELASEHDIERLLQRVTDHAVTLLGAERGFVLLLGEGGQLEAHTSRTRGGGDEPHARFSRSVAERVVETHEPVVTVSARDDERLAQALSVHQLMIQSIACVPIRGAPPVCPTIGALYVETRLRPGVRFEQEVPTLRAFADQAAIAIENARLLSENRNRADELANANAQLASARDEIARTLGRRTEQLAEAKRDLKQVRAELRSHFGYAGLVGTSAPMRRLYALIDRVKDTDVALLVSGESGTGKEIIARAVHQSGPRAPMKFVGVNCAAIPATLLESELFGSVKGAFTGADRDRRGLFREADGGTLLLDEIGEMTLKMQTGLLRVLQEKRVRPVGGAEEVMVDVRIIAATHRDLKEMVAEKSFREDLYYRLHVVELHVAPLRERSEDIPILVDHFISIFSVRYRRDRKTVSREAVRKLCAFPWPGNVRQLEHVLLNAWLMSEGLEIDVEDLELPTVGPLASVQSIPPEPHSTPRSEPTPGNRAENKADLRAVERERILRALTSANWNRVQAAKLVGLPRRTFYRRLKEFGLV
jgi:transcriptional regulator with GAF, ATPase, and Fis domain/tetratricopeptide (TPR) repeat protein